jgi:hypothetical protein
MLHLHCVAHLSLLIPTVTFFSTMFFTTTSNFKPSLVQCLCHATSSEKAFSQVEVEIALLLLFSYESNFFLLYSDVIKRLYFSDGFISLEPP